MELSGNFFDGIEQLITEAVMDDRVDTPERRAKAIATRDFCQLVIKGIDSHSLGFLDGEDMRQAMVDRLAAVGGGIAAAMGLFVAIGCSVRENTPELRAGAYKAINSDAEAFARIIAEAAKSYVEMAKQVRGGRN